MLCHLLCGRGGSCVECVTCEEVVGLGRPSCTYCGLCVCASYEGVGIHCGGKLFVFDEIGMKSTFSSTELFINFRITWKYFKLIIGATSDRN